MNIYNSTGKITGNPNPDDGIITRGQVQIDVTDSQASGFSGSAMVPIDFINAVIANPSVEVWEYETGPGYAVLRKCPRVSNFTSGYTNTLSKVVNVEIGTDGISDALALYISCWSSTSTTLNFFWFVTTRSITPGDINALLVP